MKNVRIDEKIKEKYFYYGILNKSNLEEGLIFYIASEMHKNGKKYTVVDENTHKKQYNEMNEEERNLFLEENRQNEKFENQILENLYIRDFLKCALPVFKQYYRFIILPDDKRSYTLDISNEKENFIKDNIKMKIEDMQRQKKLKAYPVGIFFTRDQEDIYMEKEWLKDLNTLDIGHYKHWTKEVYEVLIELIKLEESNAPEYYNQWIDVRLKRAKNRENQRDEVEIANIEKLREIYERKKRQYERLKADEER